MIEGKPLPIFSGISIVIHFVVRLQGSGDWNVIQDSWQAIMKVMVFGHSWDGSVMFALLIGCRRYGGTVLEHDKLFGVDGRGHGFNRFIKFL
jgi:hypothetical protein